MLIKRIANLSMLMQLLTESNVFLQVQRLKQHLSMFLIQKKFLFTFYFPYMVEKVLLSDQIFKTLRFTHFEAP